MAGLLLGGLAPALSVAADRTDRASSPFIVDSWSTGEGLPQSSVISVIQTRDGYLWLGTLNGLVRFDGNRFTVFDEENTPGLNSDPRHAKLNVIWCHSALCYSMLIT